MLKFLKRSGKAGGESLQDVLSKIWAVIEFDEKGTILDANERFLAAIGYTRDELVGKHHSMLCPPEISQSADYQSFWRDLAAGKPASGRFKRVLKSGRECYLRASYMPMLGPSGKVERVVKMAVDVTSDAEREYDNRGKIEAIGRVMAVIEFSTDGTIRTANDLFLQTVGYRREEVEGKHHRMFMPREEANSPEYARFWEGLATGTFVTGEFRRLGKGGTEIWLQASYNPILDAAGRVVKVVKYATDVTPRVRSVEMVGDALARLADGRVDVTIDTPLEPAYEPVRVSVNKLSAVYRDLVQRIGVAIGAIRGHSLDINAGAADLSERSERQAATLEEAAATMEELSGTINSTADASRGINTTVSDAASRAEAGQEVIQRATEAVRRIEESSRKINEINGVIESIAFQTNLLALNAAVEAARAGEAGKGFAVVASEVRNLAQRSSEAAADTSRLIKESSTNVEAGVQLMSSTVEVFSDIREFVGKLQRGIADISSANTEQATGVNELNQALANLDATTQSNTDLSSSNSSVARKLEAELEDLSTILGFFRSETEVRRDQRAA
ncbi:PAS domain-containing methyl-accepting chemotaxis protein [Oceanicella sp. SM1341]|uniref:methyl-accepting chemotaxis protein n=1 Tax=Oceanicella sp. SM1341 TaxID=1548889 RepID=UPI000E4A15EE|nr:PAS domain-containing methyl-accepting chemotaxis protein [Oceanicella sp. SM1341]